MPMIESACFYALPHEALRLAVCQEPWKGIWETLHAVDASEVCPVAANTMCMESCLLAWRSARFVCSRGCTCKLRVSAERRISLSALDEAVSFYEHFGFTDMTCRFDALDFQIKERFTATFAIARGMFSPCSDFSMSGKLVTAGSWNDWSGVKQLFL